MSVSAGNDAPGLSGAACVQVTTCPTAPQLQPVPLAGVEGEARGQRVDHGDGVVLALDAARAEFDTVMVYWPVPPETNVPLCVMVTLRIHRRIRGGADDLRHQQHQVARRRSTSVVPLVCPGAE